MNSPSSFFRWATARWYLYQFTVDLGLTVPVGLVIIISMLVLCNAIVIIEHDERRLGLLDATAVYSNSHSSKHTNITPAYPHIHVFTYIFSSHSAFESSSSTDFVTST